MKAATILVVDDNPENLSVMGELLRPQFRVLAANSGRHALNVIESGARPDLIVLDILMPELDGYQVLERLREATASRHIPVIFVTALADEANEERGLGLGAVDYVTKPIKPAVLLARVHTHVELKQARDRLENQNAWLESEIARRMSDNQLAQDVSIHALARLAEVRDPETGNHLRRTQEYVQSLASSLSRNPRFSDELDPRAVTLIAKSAPLHDIGKVGIPDSILLKPGKLTPAEWEIMKTHAQLGADAIAQAERDSERPVAFLDLAKTIARHHHERWDGKGYPDGLAGAAIPLPARLMAIADVFDALISRRVYKEPMAFSEARDIIAGGRNTQFDPDVVDAFLADFDGFCAIAARYADSEASVAAKIASVRGS